MSIRDIVRRERWEMNRGAHEAELMLFNMTPDIRETDGWEVIVDSYTNETIACAVRHVNENTVR